MSAAGRGYRSTARVGIAVAVSIAVLAGVGGIGVGSAVAEESVPDQPASFFGSAVDENGTAIPAGTRVVGVVDGETRGEITVEAAGSYGGEGTLDDKLRIDSGAGSEATIRLADADGPSGGTVPLEPGVFEENLTFPAGAFESVGPSPIVSVEPSPAAPDDPVSFDASASGTTGGATLTTYRWRIARNGTRVAAFDGETATERFSSTGTYRVRLDVEDDRGRNATAEATFEIEAAESDGQKEETTDSNTDPTGGGSNDGSTDGGGSSSSDGGGSSGGSGGNNSGDSGDSDSDGGDSDGEDDGGGGSSDDTAAGDDTESDGDGGDGGNGSSSDGSDDGGSSGSDQNEGDTENGSDGGGSDNSSGGSSNENDGSQSDGEDDGDSGGDNRGSSGGSNSGGSGSSGGGGGGGGSGGGGGGGGSGGGGGGGGSGGIGGGSGGGGGGGGGSGGGDRDSEDGAAGGSQDSPPDPVKQDESPITDAEGEATAAFENTSIETIVFDEAGASGTGSVSLREFEAAVGETPPLPDGVRVASASVIDVPPERREGSALLRAVVDPAWLEANDIRLDRLTVYRLPDDGERWQPLPTEATETDGGILVEAETPGFSQFVIAGTVPPDPTPTETRAGDESGGADPTPAEEGRSRSTAEPTDDTPAGLDPVRSRSGLALLLAVVAVVGWIFIPRRG